MIVSPSIEGTARRLTELLPTVDLPDSFLQRQAQFLANYGRHVFVPHGVGTSTPYGRSCLLHRHCGESAGRRRIPRSHSRYCPVFIYISIGATVLFGIMPSSWMFRDQVASKYLASRTFTASYPILHSQACSLGSHRSCIETTVQPYLASLDRRGYEQPYLRLA
jgi:hypothetical protein